jgi:hypothetical protein
VLDRGGCSTLRPGRFNPEKETRYSLCGGLGGSQVQSGQVWRVSPPQEFDPRTIQSIASRYTGYLIPAHKFNITFYKKNSNVSTVRPLTAILTHLLTFQYNEAAKGLDLILSRDEECFCSPKRSDGLLDLSSLVFSA